MGVMFGGKDSKGMREKEKYEMITLLQQVLMQPMDASAQHHSWPLELLSGSSGLDVAWTIEIFQCVVTNKYATI